MRYSTATILTLLSLSADAFLTPSSTRVSFGVTSKQLQPLFVQLFVPPSDETASDDAVVEEVAPVVAEEESSDVVEEEAPAAGNDDEEKRKISRQRHTLFVGNLPFDMTEAGIKELFEPHGKVDLVSVPRKRETGQPRGFAFVDMNSSEEMQAAIDAVEGQMVNGRIVRVSQSVPKGDVSKQAPAAVKPEFQEGFKKIYMGNIPFECTQEEVMAFYSEFGEVTEVYIPLDANTGNGRGFAFVTIKEEDADKAIEETNGQMFGGRKLVVSVPLPPGKKAPARYDDRTKLYIGNLSFYTVRDTLMEIFEEFGTVHDCYLPEDSSTGGSRGFGFVTMAKEAAVQAINEIDGCEVDGRIIRVNEAQPKGRKEESNDDEETSVNVVEADDVVEE